LFTCASQSSIVPLTNLISAFSPPLPSIATKKNSISKFSGAGKPSSPPGGTWAHISSDNEANNVLCWSNYAPGAGNKWLQIIQSGQLFPVTGRFRLCCRTEGGWLEHALLLLLSLTLFLSAMNTISSVRALPLFTFYF
jgi:hypothetical protein